MTEPLNSPSPAAMLEDAMGHLACVARYGLLSIPDQVDRDHIIAAHELVTALWRANR